MINHKANTYREIEKVLEYLSKNSNTQHQLAETSFSQLLREPSTQETFIKWAGVNPKQFLHYIGMGRAKKMLEESAIHFNSWFGSDNSSSSYLRNLSIKIEAMKPNDYKSGGQKLSINYTFSDSPFGDILIASTPKGICYIAFLNDSQAALETLEKRFPNSSYSNFTDDNIQKAISAFTQNSLEPNEIKLHVKGTEFQVKVWEALLRIPMGKLVTYGDIAKSIGKPKANRAVGSAIGNNPVAFLIPCHRVIQSSGAFGQYHWGSTRKIAMAGWEAAIIDANRG